MSTESPQPEPARYEIFVSLLTQHESQIRRFVHTLLPPWMEVDEVMQRSALAAWRKFAQFDPETSFLKWALVIARFEALAYRRAAARDRLVFSEQFLEQLAEEAAEETEIADRESHALESCLGHLSPERRELVIKAHAHGEDQQELAAALGKSPAALYMLLSRIRRELALCIERTLAREALS
ncbi:MAG: sigma-70 family RNA polymerase sigma factor [Chthoniobacter sp.]|nr:sigma-70 family RNA polymerase sigma factor [Chthoniobacter sp.]